MPSPMIETLERAAREVEQRDLGTVVGPHRRKAIKNREADAARLRELASILSDMKYQETTDLKGRHRYTLIRGTPREAEQRLARLITEGEPDGD